jgi:hypothetical protein
VLIRFHEKNIEHLLWELWDWRMAPRDVSPGPLKYLKNKGMSWGEMPWCKPGKFAIYTNSLMEKSQQGSGRAGDLLSG